MLKPRYFSHEIRPSEAAAASHIDKLAHSAMVLRMAAGKRIRYSMHTCAMADAVGQATKTG